MLSDLGSLYGERGNAKGAVVHYQQALTVVRQLGDTEAENQIRDALARYDKPASSKDTKDSKPPRKR